MIWRPIDIVHRYPEEIGFHSSVLGPAVRVGTGVSVQQGHAQLDLTDMCSGWSVYKNGKRTQSEIYTRSH